MQSIVAAVAFCVALFTYVGVASAQVTVQQPKVCPGACRPPQEIMCESTQIASCTPAAGGGKTCVCEDLMTPPVD